MRATTTTPGLLGLASLVLGGCMSFSPQTAKITQEFFPDPQADVALSTPAFQKSSGFTKHAELTAFLEQLAREHADVVRLESLGDTRKGRAIHIVHLQADSSTTGVPLRVWMQGGLHGNEPASTEGLLVFLQDLLSDSTRAALRGVHLAVVPMANPDGYDRQIRPAQGGLDLNRDQTKLLAPESRLLKRGFNAFAPHVAVDFHEYRPYRRDFIRFGERGITQIYDAMFLYSGNLNVPEVLRSFTQDVYVSAAVREVEARGLRTHDYITTRKSYGDIQFNQGSTNARASATSFALANSVSTLVEVRGVALQRDGFVRRVLTTCWIAQSFLDTARSRAADTKAVLAEAAAAVDPVVVKSRRRVGPATIRALDLAKNEEIELEITLRDALASEATLTRERPYAYLLLPEAAAQAERLRILGVDVEELSAPRTLAVERYVVTHYARDPHPYEGVVPQTVKTEVSAVDVDFPEGTFIVRMDQPRANLAAEVLEPETSNGFVGFGVLKTNKGDELPIYRRVEAGLE
jgi:hypothetical protein